MLPRIGDLNREKRVKSPDYQVAPFFKKFVSWQNAQAAKSGQGRARTADTGLFRAVLYQLSYLTWK